MLRWMTAGESHGPALAAVLEGMVAGVEVTTTEVGEQLARVHPLAVRHAFEDDLAPEGDDELFRLFHEHLKRANQLHQ